MLSVEIFAFNPFQENTYVIYNAEGECIIFDPGCYSSEEKATLTNFVNVNKLRVVQLINTHCHVDHVFGNQFIAATYSLELFIHPNEEQVLAFAPQSGSIYGVPFDNYDGPLHFLNAGDEVKIGTDKLKVLLTPGHSPGSLSFYCEADKFVIAGDVLFRESIGRTDLPGGNHQALLTSIREQIFILPNDVEVYPGHGQATSIGYEKRYNPFFSNS
jgi:hydroxyacylglutathione hydrolase